MFVPEATWEEYEERKRREREQAAPVDTAWQRATELMLQPSRGLPEIGASQPMGGRTPGLNLPMGTFRPNADAERQIREQKAALRATLDAPVSLSRPEVDQQLGEQRTWLRAGLENIVPEDPWANVNERLVQPSLEAGARLGNRAEAQSLEGWGEMGEAWRRREEPFPGFKGGLEMAAGAAVPFAGGERYGAEAVRALREGRGLTKAVEAINPAIERMLPAAKVEDVDKGLIPVYRGVGARGLAEMRPGTGLMGDGIYFSTDPLDARAFAGRDGGIIVGYVRPEDALIQGKTVLVKNPNSILRSGVLSTENTLTTEDTLSGIQKIKNAISGTPMGSPPEIGGAIVGGIAYQDDPNLSPEENLARRAAFAAGGYGLGYGARKLGSKSRLGGTIEDASQYADDVSKRYSELTSKIDDVVQRKNSLQDELRGLSEMGSIERPPMASSLSNREVEALAKQWGVNPYEKYWWEAVDPEAWKELGPHIRSGKPRSAGSIRKEIDELGKEESQLEAERHFLSKDYEKRFTELEAQPPVRPGQQQMFGQGEDLPLFSGTPMRAVESPFVPKVAERQPFIPEMKPSIEDLQPSGKGLPLVDESVAVSKALPPKAGDVPAGAPKAERVPIWQRPEVIKEAERLSGEPKAPIWSSGVDESLRPTFGEATTESLARAAQVKPSPPVNAYTQLVEALTPTKTPLRDRVRQAKDTLLRGMYDRGWNAQALEKATGIPVHKLAQVVPGAISHGEFLVEKFVQPVIASVGKDTKYLEQYLVSRRFEDVLARNPQARLPEQINRWQGTLQAQQGLKQKILSEKNGAERWQAIEDAGTAIWGKPGEPETGLNYQLILKPRLDAGLLSKEQVRNITSSNPHYVSFFREDFKGLQSSYAKGEANVTTAGLPEMDLAGSWRKLDNPLARMQAQVIATRQLIAENKAARAMADALVDLQKRGAEVKGVAAKVPLETGERYAKLVEKNQKVEPSNIWGTISYLDNGERVTYQVPALFAKMAKGLEAESVNGWSRVARIASMPLRAGAVTYNAAFVPKNVLRDLNSAFYREGLQPLSEDYARGWLAAVSHNSDYEDAARAGVLMSGIVENMRTTNALARAQLGAITVEKPADALLVLPRLIGKMAGQVEKAGIVSEQATRIATYTKLRAQGLSELDAAVRARDVTVDFAKSGNVMKIINQAIPFSNAGLQGAANTLRTMRYNPKQAIIGASPLAMVSILAYANNQRYETAKNIPEREYANNWIFVVGEGQKAVNPQLPNKEPEKFPVYIRIPKGSLGGLLTAPVEMGLRFATINDDRSVLDHLAATGLQMGTSLSPVEPGVAGVTPPLAGTAIGLFASGPGGYDTFRGKPIVPRGEQERPAESQYGPQTSNTAVALGQQFKVSPRMIEWAIKDSAAGVGSQTLWLSDTILGALGYNPVAPGEAKYVPPTEPEQVARISGGFVGTQSSEQVNRGWDAFDRAAEDSKRLLWQNSTLKSLGYLPGQVSDKITLSPGLSFTLEPTERAELQKTTGLVLKRLADLTTSRPTFQALPPVLQRKVLDEVLADGREAARQDFVGNVDPNTIKRRIVESQPLAVGAFGR